MSRSYNIIHQLVKLIPVDIQRVAGIAHSCQRTACRTALNRALTVGGGIRELAVIEDIVEVEASLRRLEPIEVYFPHGIVDRLVSKVYLTDTIVVTRLAVKEVHAKLWGIKAERHGFPCLILPGA